jgi:hypothetical protein
VPLVDHLVGSHLSPFALIRRKKKLVHRRNSMGSSLLGNSSVLTDLGDNEFNNPSLAATIARE